VIHEKLAKIEKKTFSLFPQVKERGKASPKVAEGRDDQKRGGITSLRRDSVPGVKERRSTVVGGGGETIKAPSKK